MSIEEMYAAILEANEQGDRSVILDDLREYVNAISQDISNMSEKVASLELETQTLKQRNGELFIRLDDKGKTNEDIVVKEEQEEMSFDEAVEDYMFE